MGRMSIVDRAAEIYGKLKTMIFDLMVGFLASIGCCTPDQISLYGAFKWWSLPWYDTGSLLAVSN